MALFALKGLSVGEIADLRGTSEGTVRAQTASVYRKAGVLGRSQLIAIFLDEMVETPVLSGGATAIPPSTAPPAQN